MEVRLKWDPSPSANVDGYRVFYGTSPGFHPSVQEVGNYTQCTVIGLSAETDYYFVVRAYNDAGESGDSNEVSWEG